MRPIIQLGAGRDSASGSAAPRPPVSASPTPTGAGRAFLIFLAVVGLTYFPAIRNGFVLDDGTAIVENRDLDNPSISWLFGRDYFEISREISYRPMVTLTHLLDRRWGSAGGHLLNLLLHAAVGTGLFLVGKTILSPPAGSAPRPPESAAPQVPASPAPAAMWGTLIYLVHPAYCEAVYAISFREDLLCAFFLVWTLLMALRSRPLLAGLAFALALFSKETAMPLPVLFAIMGFLPNFKILGRTAPLLILVDAVYAWIRFVVLPGPGMDIAKPGGWFLRETAVFSGYARLFFFPSRLSIDHVIAATPEIHVVAFGVILALGVLIFTGVQYFKKNLNAVPGLWFILFLLPVMDIVPILHPSAERYLYIPFLLPALAVGQIIVSQSGRISASGASSAGVSDAGRDSASGASSAGVSDAGRIRRRFGIWACLIVLILGARTHIRGWDFRDARTLNTAEMKSNPKSLVATWVLGQMELQSGNMDQARSLFGRVLELDPLFHPVYFDLGRLEHALNNRAEARRWFEAAYAASPSDPEAALYLAECIRQSGDTAAAEPLYRIAAQLPPHPTGMTQRFLDFHRSLRRNLAISK